MFRVILPNGNELSVPDIDTLQAMAQEGSISPHSPILETSTGKTIAAGDHPFLSRHFSQAASSMYPSRAPNVHQAQVQLSTPSGQATFRSGLVWGMWGQTLIAGFFQIFGNVILGWFLEALSVVVAIILVCSKNNAERINGIVRMVIEVLGILILVLGWLSP